MPVAVLDERDNFRPLLGLWRQLSGECRDRLPTDLARKAEPIASIASIRRKDCEMRQRVYERYAHSLKAQSPDRHPGGARYLTSGAPDCPRLRENFARRSASFQNVGGTGD